MDATSREQGERVDEFTLALTLWDATLDGRVEWQWDSGARTPGGIPCEEYRAEFEGTVYRVSGWGVRTSGAIVGFWSGPSVSDLFRLCAANHDREAAKEVSKP